MSTPAKVSGPGKFSQRTDQGKVDIPNADYGEQQAYQQLESGAPMAASSGQPSMASTPQLNLGQLFGGAGANVVPLSAPTQRPNEPVTTPAIPGIPQSQQDMSELASQLPVLEFMGNQPNASWGLRNLVRQIKGAM